MCSWWHWRLAPRGHGPLGEENKEHSSRAEAVGATRVFRSAISARITFCPAPCRCGFYQGIVARISLVANDLRGQRRRLRALLAKIRKHGFQLSVHPTMMELCDAADIVHNHHHVLRPVLFCHLPATQNTNLRLIRIEVNSEQVIMML